MKTVNTLHSFQKMGINKNIIIIFLLLLPTILSAQEALWARTIGSSDVDEITSITYDDEGCVYITGTFSGTVNFNPYLFLEEDNRTSNGGKDVFIQKYDFSASTLFPVAWTHTFGGSGDESVADMDIIIDKIDDGTHLIAIAGDYVGEVDFDPSGSGDIWTAYNRDVFVKYLDSDGNYVRTKVFGGSGNALAKAIAFTSETHIAITGDFTGSIDIMPESPTMGKYEAHGNKDIFLANMGLETGNYTLLRHIGGPGLDEVYCLDKDEDDNIIIGGAFSETAEFMSGSETAIGETDMFLASYSNLLNWVKTFGNEDENKLTAMTIEGDTIWSAMSFYNEVTFQVGMIGGTPLYNSYTSSGSKDVLLMKHQTEDGGAFSQQWRRIGGSDAEEITAMKIDSKNNVVITGFFKSSDLDLNPHDEDEDIYSTNGNHDIFLALLTNNYEFIWGGAVGGTTSADVPASLALKEGGTIYNAGRFNGDVNFNPWEGDAIDRSSSGFSNGYFWAVNSYSNQCNIISFELAEQTSQPDINSADNEVTIQVEEGTDITSLSPEITISDGAEIDPPSGQTGDFSDAYTYTVTAENGVDQKQWKVYVSVATGEESPLADHIQIYPIPAVNSLFIELPEALINKIEVYTLSGKQLVSAKYEQRKVHLNVENLPEGAYLINIITSDNQSISKQIVVSH